jgi:anhydro-N-acetylmuramic acid kinase
VKHWYIAGGGRHNPVLMAMLAFELNEPVGNVDVLGWQGDFIEAEGFAFLAIRVILGYPLTWPGTTGVAEPLSGGMEHKAGQEKARTS